MTTRRWYGLKPEYREEKNPGHRNRKRERDIAEPGLNTDSRVIFAGDVPERGRGKGRGEHPEVMIGPSSISPGGYGLYSLKHFEAGEFLPVTYNGLVLSERDYNELDDYLLKMANTYEEKHRQPNEREIDYLRGKWGVEIRFMERGGLGNHWIPLSLDPAQMMHMKIDWDSIYDHFSDYSFEYFDNNGKNYIIYWPIYNYDGRAIVDERNPDNAGLMLNEPPDSDYYSNEFEWSLTVSMPNVKAEFNPALKKLGLKVISPVRAGEEFLLCYGPLYHRHGYFVNSSPVVGCGQQAYLESYLKPGFTYDRPLRDQLNTEWKRKVAKFPPQSREAFYAYLEQIDRRAGHGPIPKPNIDENVYFSEIIDQFAYDNYLVKPQYLINEAPQPTDRWIEQRKERRKRIYGEQKDDPLFSFAGWRKLI